MIAGYEAPIHRALWQRITSMGVPRLWATVWLVLCLYAALVFLSVLGMRWALLPLGIWTLGQGLLMALTLWDVHWDDLAIAHLTRKYHAFYDAG